jgi:hypothetical protein
MGSLAFGQDGQVQYEKPASEKVASKATDSKATDSKATDSKATDSKATDSKATDSEARQNNVFAPVPGVPSESVPLTYPPMNGSYLRPAPEKSSGFEQFPPGLSMSFKVSGSFDLSFNMKVDKEQAKEKAHKKVKAKKRDSDVSKNRRPGKPNQSAKQKKQDS